MTLAVSLTGAFMIFLDSTHAQLGCYPVEMSGASGEAATGLCTADSASLRRQEAGGQV